MVTARSSVASSDPLLEGASPDYIISPRHEEYGESLIVDVDDASTERPQHIDPEPKPVLRFPVLPTPRSRFKVLQKWEGTVKEISERECISVIRNLTTPENPDEEMAFSFEEIPQSDGDLVAPGAIFYWYIGYEDRIDGQRNRVSSIRFRRLPVWTEKELTEARHKAETLGDHIGWK